MLALAAACALAATGSPPVPRGLTATVASAVRVEVVAPGVGQLRPAISTFTTSCPATTAVVHSRAPGLGKTVALTFDDGPGRSTTAILDVLARYHVPATFFNVGSQLATRSVQLRREVLLGATVGNHTWNHPDLRRLSWSAQASQLDWTTGALLRLGSVRPCVFRPPYGYYNLTTLRVATQRRLSVWTWSVDTLDWQARGSGSSYWVRRIESRAAAGLALTHPVVLMHNSLVGNPATVSALPWIIATYRNHGYRFVRLG